MRDSSDDNYSVAETCMRTNPTTRILQDQSSFFFFFFFSFFSVTPRVPPPISGMKRATGDPLVSKRPDFLGPFRFSEEFFGFLAIYRERKELPEMRGCQNNRIFYAFQLLMWVLGAKDEANWKSRGTDFYFIHNTSIFWCDRYASRKIHFLSSPLIFTS